MFRGRYDGQRTPAIQIAAITLTSDSAIAIARFRPSKDTQRRDRIYACLSPLDPRNERIFPRFGAISLLLSSLEDLFETSLGFWGSGVWRLLYAYGDCNRNRRPLLHVNRAPVASWPTSSLPADDSTIVMHLPLHPVRGCHNDNRYEE